MAHCSSCKIENVGTYCSICGKLLVFQRIDKYYVVQELLKLVGYEKGFVYTVKELALRPGQVIRNYISEDRDKITKPITFLILTSLLYTFISHYFKTDIVHSNMLKMLYQDSFTYQLSNWVQNNYGYANLLMLAPITLWTKFLFSDYKYNVYETFVMTSLIMAEGMLLYTLHTLMNRLFPTAILVNEVVITLVIFSYLSWAIGQFYGGKFTSYFRAFLSYILGVVTFQVLIVVLGVIGELVLKKG